jgi:hypothetical protein
MASHFGDESLDGPGGRERAPCEGSKHCLLLALRCCTARRAPCTVRQTFLSSLLNLENLKALDAAPS